MKGYFLNISDITFIKDNYALGYVVRAKEGQTVTSYLESTTMFDTYIEGCDKDITHDGTINSIACGTEAIPIFGVAFVGMRHLFEYFSGNFLDEGDYLIPLSLSAFEYLAALSRCSE